MGFEPAWRWWITRPVGSSTSYVPKYADDAALCVAKIVNRGHLWKRFATRRQQHGCHGAGAIVINAPHWICAMRGEAHQFVHPRKSFARGGGRRDRFASGRRGSLQPGQRGQRKHPEEIAPFHGSPSVSVRLQPNVRNSIASNHAWGCCTIRRRSTAEVTEARVAWLILCVLVLA